MIQTILRSIINLADTALILYAVISSIRLINRKRLSVSVIFFIMGTMCLVVSLFYWMAYDFIMPADIRMPFAANELSESAAFLLIAASLRNAAGDKFSLFTKKTVTAVLFVICNVILWISWSGEVAQDIICGITFGYLLITAFNFVDHTGIVSGKFFFRYPVFPLLLLFLQAVQFFVPSKIVKPVDFICYILIFLTSAYCVLAAYREIKSGSSGISSLSISAFSFVWTTVCMYMSSEPMYFFPDILSNISIILMAVSFRKAVNEA